MTAISVQTSPAPLDAGQQLSRANGGASVAFARRRDGDRLAHLEQTTPWRVLFPRGPADEPPLAVFANIGGGVCGGDRARLAAAAGPGAHLTATTQAAEKVYRSTGPDATLDTKLSAGPGAWLEWLPQETILFDRSRFARHTDVHLSGDARFLAAEMTVYGRGAHGETWRSGLFSDRWRIRRDGRLVWADSLWLDDRAVFDSPSGFADARATATVIAAGPGAAALIDTVRETPPPPQGRIAATIINGVLVVRLLGIDPQPLRATLAAVAGTLRHAWAGLPPRVPRLWLM